MIKNIRGDRGVIYVQSKGVWGEIFNILVKIFISNSVSVHRNISLFGFEFHLLEQIRIFFLFH